MGDLSEHFDREEFACRCGCGFGLDPYDVDLELVAALEMLRELVGVPIHINSGCRCKSHNRRVGGAKNSRHMVGDAADIHCKGVLPFRLASLAKKVPAFNDGGIGIYEHWVHVDTRDGKARWGEE